MVQFPPGPETFNLFASVRSMRTIQQSDLIQSVADALQFISQDVLACHASREQ